MIPSMAIALLNFGTAYTALCVWLTVRVVNRRERWAKWTLAALVVVLPLLYVLCFGPWCWFASRNATMAEVPVVYEPMMRLTASPAWVFTAWYGGLFVSDGIFVWNKAGTTVVYFGSDPW
jgi:hypothetical protein